jgi:ribonuclease Z
MKKIAVVVAALAVAGVGHATSLRATARLQDSRSQPANGGTLQVLLLGTLSGPSTNAQRLGIATLVVAGPEKLLFDAGRGVTTGMARLAINPVDVTKVFMTHLHSDHIVGIPELYLFPWASQVRVARFEVWGPDGTRAMMEHLQRAFAYDIHVRRDVDEKFSAEGIKVKATDVREGIVYEAHGVKVTAFLVDHGPVSLRSGTASITAGIRS